MKNLKLIALLLSLSGVCFAQATPTTKTEPTKPTTAAKAPEKTDACKGLEGTKLQDCLNAQKAKGTTTQPTATSKPATTPPQN